MSWSPLGAIPPRELSDTRKKLHRASQWLARIARSYYPEADDDSHTALTLHPPSGAAGLPEVEGEKGPVIPAFILPEMALALSHETDGLILGLRDMDEGEREANVRKALETVGLDPARLQLDLPYTGELPATGDAAPDPADAVELTRYYANMWSVLDGLSAPRISPIRLWPHHFDLARLIALDEGGGEEARSVGVGLAPDDGAYNQPYLYIAPWPPAAITDRPAPPEGLKWHTDGFLALVATAEEVLVGEDASERVSRAVDEGVRLCRDLLMRETL